MKKFYDSIIRFMLNDKTWILSAVCLLILVVCLLVALGTGKLFQNINGLEIIKDVIFPIAAAAAFCVGFSLTIRHSKAIEAQTESTRQANDLRKNELQQRKDEFSKKQEQEDFNRFKEIIKSFDDGGLLTIDALEDLVCKAKIAGTNRDIDQVQKIVTVLCSFIKIHSNKESVKMSEIDSNWNGYSKNEKTPSFIIQKILNYLFPIITKKEDENVFYANRQKLEFDLTSCNLQNMDLSKRALYGVNFGGSAMHNIQMYETTCNNCEFWGTYLQAANLTCSNFNNCNFSGAKAVWAKFCGSNFHKSKFNRADLTCSLLSNVVLDNVVLTDAVLDGSDIYRQCREGSHTEEPLCFKEPGSLGISLKFSFIYPVQHLSPKDLVIDSCKEIYDNPINRLDRLIQYLKLLIDNNSVNKVSLDRNVIQSNKDVLLDICKKALKYAVIDVSTGLTEQNYIIWTNRMKKLMSTVNSGKTEQQNEPES